MGLVECVPNFSEGRNAEVVDEIVRAVESRGAAVLGRTMDPDHARAVVTFAGRAGQVADAALAAAGVAIRRIDMRKQSGVHPRLGAADVIPFVPLGTTTLDACVELAHATGLRIWEEFGVPVYFYEAAAVRPGRARLEQVRRGGLERRAAMIATDPGMSPDIGGTGLHPTAGACIVGARRFLIAWNVNLARADLTLAQRIAAEIRESLGGMPCVKAIGVPLASRGLVQVSMNLTDFERTPLSEVYDRVRRAAEAAGAHVVEAELIGLLPERAYLDAVRNSIPFSDFGEHRVIERRIASLQ